MLAGGYGGAPAPFNPDVERKVTPEIPASPEVPPVPAIVIPPPEGRTSLIVNFTRSLVLELCVFYCTAQVA